MLYTHNWTFFLLAGAAAAAAAAFALNLLLVPVLGISFWARDRGTRRLEARLAEPRGAPPDGPLA